MPVTAAAIQAGVGLVQTVGGWIQQGKATKNYEKTLANNPKYNQNESILDYYNKALQRYNVNATDSAMYKRNMQNIGRNTATGINALNDRRSGIAGISSILRGANDAALDTEVAAENEKSDRFGVLGGATGMKAGEDRMAFDVNQMQPWQNKLSLYGAKATGGANIMNAGVGTLNNAANNYQQMQMLQQMYGINNSRRTTSTNRLDTTIPINTRGSDIRLKENYYIVGKSPSGINIYEFSYKGNYKRYVGVMAHEVPFAAVDVNGYLYVDYSKIDIEFKEV